jgi:hypothetical protein
MPLLCYLPMIVWMGMFRVGREDLRVPVNNQSADLSAH